MAVSVIDGLDPMTPIDTIHHLASGTSLVFDVMRGGDWMTIPEIQIAVQEHPRGRYFSEATISARIRDLRKTKNGGHTVQRRLRNNTRNFYEYKLLPNDEEYMEVA